MVLAVGVAVTVAPVVADIPVAGDQVYVLAPEAVMLRPAVPEQVLPPAGVVLITGNGFIVTIPTEDIFDKPDAVHVVVHQ